jgi:hypothetical protein
MVSPPAGGRLGGCLGGRRLIFKINYFLQTIIATELIFATDVLCVDLY